MRGLTAPCVFVPDHPLAPTSLSASPPYPAQPSCPTSPCCLACPLCTLVVELMPREADQEGVAQ